MTNNLLFGTSGVPHSSSLPTTESGIRRIAELGLGCMEVAFVQGVRMSADHALRVGAVAKEAGVALSVHAPYYINFNSDDPLKIAASKQRLLQTARIAYLFGGVSAVFHAGFYMGRTPMEAYREIKSNVGEVPQQLQEEGNTLKLRPEIMGKLAQFGDLDEVLELCYDLPGLAPCIDFAHLHARAGEFNTYEEFVSVLERIKAVLGQEALKDMHIHVAGIHYGRRGERNHLELDESDFRYLELLQALHDYEVRGLVICESPNLEEDALMLQKEYQGIRKRIRGTPAKLSG